MNKLRKYILLGLLIFAGHLLGFGQEKSEPRFHIGLNVYDALLQNIHTQATFRVGKHFGVYANLGYCLFRKYKFQKTLTDRVRGNFQGFGAQWRFRNPNGKGEVYTGIGILWGMQWHQVQASIPNYYGDVRNSWTAINSYVALQANVGYAWLINRWRIEAGIRISVADNNGYGDRFLHSYMPAVGRVTPWAYRTTFRSTRTLTPNIAIGYRL